MTPQEKARRESVVEKVRKLLTLAARDDGSATPAERELAERRAAEIMTRHDIAVFDLEDAEKGAIEKDADVVDGMTEQWRGTLTGRICVAMGGDYYVTRFSRTRTQYTLVGRPDTIAFARVLAGALIPWLQVECAIARTAAVDRGERGICSRCNGAGETRREKGGGMSYFEHTCPTCHGSGQVPLNARVFDREFYDAAAWAISSRLKAQRRTTADEVRGTGSGQELVRNDRSAIDRYYKDSGIKLRAGRSSATPGGAAAGRAAGRSAGARAALAPTPAVSAGRGSLPRARS